MSELAETDEIHGEKWHGLLETDLLGRAILSNLLMHSAV